MTPRARPDRNAAPRMASYEDTRAAFRVDVPERYNAVLDIVDRWAAEDPGALALLSQGAAGETIGAHTAADLARESRRSSRRPGCPGRLSQNRTSAVHIRLFGTAGCYPRGRPVHDLPDPGDNPSCTGATTTSNACRLPVQLPAPSVVADRHSRDCSSTSAPHGIGMRMAPHPDHVRLRRPSPADFCCLEEQVELTACSVDRDRLPSLGGPIPSWGRLSTAFWYYAILRLLPGHRLSSSRSTGFRFHGTRQISWGKLQQTSRSSCRHYACTSDGNGASSLTADSPDADALRRFTCVQNDRAPATSTRHALAGRPLRPSSHRALVSSVSSSLPSGPRDRISTSSLLGLPSAPFLGASLPERVGKSSRSTASAEKIGASM